MKPITTHLTPSAGNYGRLAHIDNLEIAEIAEVGESYRFGFNGKERDDEMKGSGNSYDFGARILDVRLGRWLSTDPMEARYPDISPYVYAGNIPILFIDVEGKKFVNPYEKDYTKAKIDLGNAEKSIKN